MKKLLILILLLVASPAFAFQLTGSGTLTYPTLGSFAVDGTAVTATASEAATVSSYTTGDLTMTCTTAGSVTISGFSCTGTACTGTGSASVANGDTCTIAYDGDAYMVDTDGLDVGSFSGTSVTVNTASAACTKDTTPIISATSYPSESQSGFFDTGTTDAKGQSFTVASSFDLYSVEIYFVRWSDSTPTIRIGSAYDLTTYTEEITGDSVTASGFQEIVSADNPTLAAGAWYFGAIEAGGDIALGHTGTNDYSGGQGISSTGTGWSMAAPSSSTDVIFRIYRCQP